MKAQVHTAKLANGLTLLGESNPHHKSVTLGFFVRTGSRDEQPVESGISHFLEHMMFKGTAKRTTFDITFHLGNIGAQSNAYTSEENTVYYASVLGDYFKDALEILSDMLRPSLDPSEFDMEKKVILEEIALYDDRPQFYFFDHATRDYFGSHCAGNSVLGTTDSVSAITVEQMRDYFSRRYSPSNMVLVASGNFSWDELQRDAEKYCGSWKDHAASRTLTRHHTAAKKAIFKKKDITQEHILFLTEGAGVNDEERYGLAILSMILGDGVGSKTYWELVDKGLAESASIDSDEKDGTGMFLGYAATEPEKVEQVSDILRGILAKPLDFSDEELARAKTKLAARLALHGELPMGRFSSLGNEYIYRGQIHNLKEEVTRIRSVSRKEIEQALARFQLNQWSEYRLVAE